MAPRIRPPAGFTFTLCPCRFESRWLLLISPPHFCSHYTTWGKNYPAAEKLSGGLKTMRRRNNYPWPAQVGQKFEKLIQKLSHSAKNTLFHIFIHWTKLYIIFIHRTELYSILLLWAELYPISIHCRTLPYLNTLSRTIPYVNTLSRTHPILVH